jgi:hypothetical protein
LPKSTTELENAINNSPYFTITGENRESARSTAKAKLVLNLWKYVKDRRVNRNYSHTHTYSEYGEEVWNAIEESIEKFVPGAGGTFLHYFNGNCSRFLKHEIHRKQDEMDNTGLKLKSAKIQFVKKIRKYKDYIEQSRKGLSFDQTADLIAKIYGCTKEEVIEGLKGASDLYSVSLDEEIYDSDGNNTTLLDTIVDSNSTFHLAMPLPQEEAEKKDAQRVVIDAMEYVFTQKTKDSQKPLLKQMLTLEYDANKIPPDAVISFLDHDLLSRLRTGEKITRREIAVAFYPRSELNSAEASAKKMLDRFMKKVRGYLEKKSEKNA